MKHVIFENSFEFNEDRKLYVSTLQKIGGKFHLIELEGFVRGFRMYMNDRHLKEFVLCDTIHGYDNKVFCWKYGTRGGISAKIYRN
jgi:hypothetical protein